MPSNESEQLAKFKAILRRLDVKHSAQWGRIGEKFAHVNQEKVRIPSLTKTAVYRIPDILSDSELIEIKNVKHQRFTNQIKDFLLYCSQTQRRFILFTRRDTKLSAKLSEMAGSGEIEVRYLSVIFTQESQKRLKKAFEPILAQALKKILEKDSGSSET